MNELKPFDSERIYWAVEQVERVGGDIDTLHLADNQFYLKSEADKVIAELKDKCNMHDFFWEGCSFAKRGFKNTIAVSEAQCVDARVYGKLGRVCKSCIDKYCQFPAQSIPLKEALKRHFKAIKDTTCNCLFCRNLNKEIRTGV